MIWLCILCVVIYLLGALGPLSLVMTMASDSRRERILLAVSALIAWPVVNILAAIEVAKGWED